jgi:hypothetical protein
MEQVTFKEYKTILETVLSSNKVAFLNLDMPNETDKKTYFKSLEGISWLANDGFMGGLCRFKEGKENISQLHQNHRIFKGGYFLECYAGKLNKLYEKQGFKNIAYLKFNPEFAKEGWKNDSILKSQPIIMFMSLFGVDKSYHSLDYDNCYNFARDSKKPKNILVRTYQTNRDKTNYTLRSLKDAYELLGKSENDVCQRVAWLNHEDIFFKETKDYIRVTY